MNASPSSSHALPVAGASATTATGVILQLASAAVLGMAVLYGVAFAESPTLHNAAHDVRHVTVKPCH
ncbi:MAG: hypothetical protein JWP29_2780 [Rhodoferax sp.]|nr:hypothetical protein [Rhodoferax sp.]